LRFASRAERTACVDVEGNSSGQDQDRLARGRAGTFFHERRTCRRLTEGRSRRRLPTLRSAARTGAAPGPIQRRSARTFTVQVMGLAPSARRSPASAADFSSATSLAAVEISDLRAENRTGRPWHGIRDIGNLPAVLAGLFALQLALARALAGVRLAVSFASIFDVALPSSEVSGRSQSFEAVRRCRCR
jgi:hypothetical protein